MKKAGLLILAALLASGAVAPRTLAEQPAGKNRKTPAIAAIDINRATVEDFDKLPGIGPELARRIVAYREKHGPFRRIEDLMAVRGMGAKKWRVLKPYLRVEGNHSKTTS
jgi:competence protein ComEA